MYTTAIAGTPWLSSVHIWKDCVILQSIRNTSLCDSSDCKDCWANTNSLTYFPVSTHGYARLNWPGLLAIYQDGVGELINNLASAAHRQTICVHHYRLTGPVMTLPLTLKTFSAMPTQMMNICDTFHWNLSTD